MEPAHAHRWIDAARPTHPSVIDTRHVTDELFGFVNIPMAVWIDERGVLVRPAEAATIERSPLRDAPIPAGLPERIERALHEVKKMPDLSEEYRAAIVDWARHGADSRFALTPEEVVSRSVPRGADEARAAACFELGEYLRREIGGDASVRWWREAHRLQPGNWTYKRQAWTLVTTPPDATDNDLLQGPNDTYDGNWLDDVLAGGGGEAYTIPPRL